MTPMTHPDDRQLQALARGETISEAVAHLAGCQACADEVAGYQALFGGLEALTDPEPDAAFATEVMTRIARESVAVARLPRRLVGALAAFLALAGGGLLALVGVSGAGVGPILTGLSEAMVTAAKLRTLLGTLADALPGAALGLLLAQVLFLFGVLFLLTRMMREPAPAAARIA